MMNHFPAQLDFSGHQKGSYPARANGYLPSPPILGVIQWAALGTAITLVLMSACLSHLPLQPPRLVFGHSLHIHVLEDVREKEDNISFL